MCHAPPPGARQSIRGPHPPSRLYLDLNQRDVTLKLFYEIHGHATRPLQDLMLLHFLPIFFEERFHEVFRKFRVEPS